MCLRIVDGWKALLQPLQCTSSVSSSSSSVSDIFPVAKSDRFPKFTVVTYLDGGLTLMEVLARLKQSVIFHHYFTMYFIIVVSWFQDFRQFQTGDSITRCFICKKNQKVSKSAKRTYNQIICLVTQLPSFRFP